MARRKLGHRNIRKLTRTGSSYAVTLPIDVIRKFKWKERQKLQLTIHHRKKSIEIKDWHK